MFRVTVLVELFKKIEFAVDYLTEECSSTSKDFFAFCQSVWETKVIVNRKHYYSTLVQIRFREPSKNESGKYEVDLIFVDIIKTPHDFFTETLMFDGQWSLVGTQKYTNNDLCDSTLWMGFKSIYKSFDGYKFI